MQGMKSRTVKDVEAQDFLDCVIDTDVSIAKAWLIINKVYLIMFVTLT